MAAWYNLQRNRSGSVLGDLGVAQVGFSFFGSPSAGGGWFGARGATILIFLCFFLWCKGELMGRFVCKSRNVSVLAFAVCAYSKILISVRQRALFIII